MALEKPLFLQPVSGDPEISYTAQDYRGLISALAPVAGTVLAADLKVTPRAAGANMSVDVAAGRAVVAGTSIARQGTYIVQNTAAYNVPIAAANATNPRIDLIVARVYDKQAAGGTRYDWAPEPVTGTAAATPAAPTVPVSSLVLAHVYVPAGAVSIGATRSATVGDVTDKRVLSGVGDVPKWDYNGLANVNIPNITDTKYAPAGAFELIGMGTAGMASGEVQCVTPGRYAVHFCARFAAGGTFGERYVAIALTNAAGTTRLRTIASGTETAGTATLTASGTLYMSAGQRAFAYVFQNSGGVRTYDDAFAHANFTGVWVGP